MPEDDGTRDDPISVFAKCVVNKIVKEYTLDVSVNALIYTTEAIIKNMEKKL